MNKEIRSMMNHKVLTDVNIHDIPHEEVLTSVRSAEEPSPTGPVRCCGAVVLSRSDTRS